MSTVFRTLFEASTVEEGADWVRGLPEWHELITRAHVRVSCVPLHFYRQRNSPVGTWLNFMIKTSQRLILHFVWHVSTNCNMTLSEFHLDLPMPREFGVCTKRANKNEVFRHKWWTLSNKSNIYCGTGIPVSAFWWRSSKVSDYFYLNFCFLWLLSLAGKMTVFLWLGADLT
jgi:hypothetical protein